MGRGVESYLVTLALKNGSKGMGAGSFAVGSGYVDGLVLLMRVTEVIIQGECGLQAWLVSLRSDFFKDNSFPIYIIMCINKKRQSQHRRQPMIEIASNLLFV